MPSKNARLGRVWGECPAHRRAAPHEQPKRRVVMPLARRSEATQTGGSQPPPRGLIRPGSAHRIGCVQLNKLRASGSHKLRRCNSVCSYREAARSDHARVGNALHPAPSAGTGISRFRHTSRQAPNTRRQTNLPTRRERAAAGPSHFAPPNPAVRTPFAGWPVGAIAAGDRGGRRPGTPRRRHRRL